MLIFGLHLSDFNVHELCSKNFNYKVKYSQVNLDVDILFLVICTPSSRVKLKRIIDILPRKLLNTNIMSHELLPLTTILY